MSSVNFLEKLLDGVSVEWKALKDLTLPTKNIKWREAKRTYRYIDLTSVSIETKAITETIEISSDDAPSRAQKIVEKNDVIFATTRPTQKRYCLIGDQYSGERAVAHRPGRLPLRKSALEDRLWRRRNHPHPRVFPVPDPREFSSDPPQARRLLRPRDE